MKVGLARLWLAFLILIIPVTVAAFIGWLIRDVSIVVLGYSLPAWVCLGGGVALAFGALAWWTWDDLSRGIREEIERRR